jgi:hydrogenase-4 membrane subunit HyfE
VQLFTIAFQRPIEFGISVAVVTLMIVILLRSAMAAEAPNGISRMMASPNAKLLFGALFVAWAVVFGIGLQLVPHEGANSPYGGLALIALFTGFFIMMGFLWAVIGE